MLLFEIFVAGVPSTILSLQPNSERVRGKFILYVISRSIPAAITLTLAVMTVYLGSTLLPLTFETNFYPMLMLIVTFTGLVMLFRILQPFNVLRAVVYAAMVTISIVVVAVPILGNIVYTDWDQVVFNITEILFMICILLAAFPVSNTLTRVFDLMNSTD